MNLDQLLLQNTPQNASTLSNLQSNLLGQYGLANTENQAIQNAATARQNDIQGTQQAAQNIQDVLYGIPTGTLVDQSGNPVYSTSPTANAPGSVQNNLISTPVNGTTSSGPTATTAPIVNQQYGLLTNLYNQLVAQPGQETAQQQATLTADQQNLTNYLTNTYGSNILGIPIATLVQQAFTPAGTGANSSGATANVVNTMTPQQLAQLQTLNQFAGLSGTNINQIGQTGGATTQVIDPTQVGTNQFNPTINNNIAAAQNTVNQAQQAYTTDMNSQIQNAYNQPVQYNGKTLTGQAGVQSALSNLTINMHNPSGDATQLSNYYNTLNNQLATINATRAAYGQPPVSVPYSAVQAAQTSLFNNMVAQFQAAGLTPAAATQRASNWAGGAIDAAANLTAINQTLQGLQTSVQNGPNDQIAYNPSQTYTLNYGGIPTTQGGGHGLQHTPVQGPVVPTNGPPAAPTATF